MCVYSESWRGIEGSFVTSAAHYCTCIYKYAMKLINLVW